MKLKGIWDSWCGRGERWRESDKYTSSYSSLTTTNGCSIIYLMSMWMMIKIGEIEMGDQSGESTVKG